MADPGTLAGPPGWLVTAFNYAVNRADRNSTVTEQIRLARAAGYEGTRPQLIAIGQGLLSQAAFAAGQGGGPGNADRTAPGPPRVASTPPLIPVPGLPPLPGMTPPVPVSPGTPPIAGGPSIPDRIPPRVSVGTGAIGAVLSRVIGAGVGALFYPRSTSATDEVCIETQYGPYCPPGLPVGVLNVPAAVPRPAGPRRRGRVRPVTPAAPPRRRERGRTLPAPTAPVRTRGRPQTISRPVVVPQARVVSPTMPRPSSLPPTVGDFPIPSTPARPAAVPAPAARVSLPAVLPLVLPFVGSLFSTAAGSQTGLGSAAVPRPAIRPGIGSVTLPGSFPASLPLPNLALQPLTAFSTAVAQSPAQDLDRQCRERAERKRKKRKPRSVCYRGTFTETSKSTFKRRKEKIKCR